MVTVGTCYNSLVIVVLLAEDFLKSCLVFNLLYVLFTCIAHNHYIINLDGLTKEQKIPSA